MFQAGFSGMTYDKIDDPALNFSTHEGRAECGMAKFQESFS